MEQSFGKTMKKLTCTRCNKKVQHLATTGRNPKELYTICWDCLIELDIITKTLKNKKKHLTHILFFVSSYIR